MEDFYLFLFFSFFPSFFFPFFLFLFFSFFFLIIIIIQRSTSILSRECSETEEQFVICLKMSENTGAKYFSHDCRGQDDVLPENMTSENSVEISKDYKLKLPSEM